MEYITITTMNKQQLKRWGYATITVFVFQLILFTLLGSVLPGILRVEAKATGFIPTVATEAITEPKTDTSRLLIELTGSMDEKGEQLMKIAEQAGARGEEISYLLHIAYHESKFNSKVEPYTYVTYCSDGNWGEIYNGGQFRCEDFGSKTVKKIKSYGLYQILPDTASGHGCSSDWKANAYTQTGCALTIARTSGWSQWSTYNQLLK